MINNWESVLLGIIEGLTEFLPISSTAHLIVSEKLLDLQSSSFLNFFTIFIQLGAISAVPLLYFKRLTSDLKIYKFIIISFIPAVIFGVLLDDLLESFFQGYWFIAFSWFLGGILLYFIDRLLVTNEDVSKRDNLLDELSVTRSLKVGLYQCLAMIPGVSRSGATIIGGRLVGLNHKMAVEYSFLLGIPTILGACAKKLLDYKNELPSILNAENLISLTIGFLVSLLIALITIKWMVGFVEKHGFKIFGVYRILAGVLLMIYLLWI
ncbi:undecaprenyl-diphosphate phosphatase [Aquirufa sp. ROCK-SH2]